MFHKIISRLQDLLELFLTKFTSIIAALFIICSIAIVAISRDELRETQSVLEKEEEENSKPSTNTSIKII